jgi:hypothetical protein
MQNFWGHKGLNFQTNMHIVGEEVWFIVLTAAKKSMMTLIFAQNAALKRRRAELPMLLILPTKY